MFFSLFNALEEEEEVINAFIWNPRIFLYALFHPALY